MRRDNDHDIVVIDRLVDVAENIPQDRHTSGPVIPVLTVDFCCLIKPASRFDSPSRRRNAVWTVRAVND